MQKLSVLEEFDVAIKAVARDAHDSVTSRQLAEEFDQAEAALVRHLEREWRLEKLTSIIARHRAEIRRARNPQRILGFRVIRKRITLQSGKKVREGEMTLNALRFWREKVATEDHPTTVEIDKRIAFMLPWSKSNPGISFEKACELEAAKKK